MSDEIQADEQEKSSSAQSKLQKKLTENGQHIHSIQIKATLDYRSKLLANHKLWKESLSSMGLSRYQGTIPAQAITKITVFDWRSNWMITKEVLHVGISTKLHKIQMDRHKMLTRWLMCEAVSPKEWILDFEKLPAFERDHIQQGLINKSGLDIFYQQTNGRYK
jgi:hypothetical protein